MQPSAPYRLMLVEDNPGDVFLLQEAFRENNIDVEVTRFENGEVALESLLPGKESPGGLVPDVIILDLNLPRLEGLQVLQAIRRSASFRDVPVAVVTSSDSPKDCRDALALGATCYIRKSLRFDEFVSHVGSAIKEMLER
jgi:DNA-binding response OmpR family regulator